MLGSEPLIVGLVLERKFDLDVDCPNPKLLRVNSFPSGRKKCPNIKNMLPNDLGGFFPVFSLISAPKIRSCPIPWPSHEIGKVFMATKPSLARETNQPNMGFFLICNSPLIQPQLHEILMMNNTGRLRNRTAYREPNRQESNR